LKKLDLLIIKSTFIQQLLIITFFVFSAAFIPFLGSFCLILFPMIIFVLGTINGEIKTATAFFISCLLLLTLSFLLHQGNPLLPIVTLGLSGLFIARIVTRNKSAEKVIAYPALLIIASICFYFIYSSFEQSVNTWQLIQKYVASIIDANVKLYSQLPLAKEDIDFIKNNQQNITIAFTRIFPSLIAIIAVFIVWINVLIGKNVLNKAGISRTNLAMLASWKTPDFFIWIFIISGGLNFVPNENINLLALNLFLVICFIYLLQGLAIISFIFQSKKVPIFFRFIFYFLIAVQQFLMIPIATAGLFDIWVDFRKFVRKDQKTDIVS
jgi:uncharacterized protein YybS (DUF2232 family)